MEIRMPSVGTRLMADKYDILHNTRSITPQVVAQIMDCSNVSVENILG